MSITTYLERRGELQTYFDRTAVDAWARLTSDAPLGRIRATESVIHDLCPHDISLILAIMGGMPERVGCSGASHVTPGNVDTLSGFLAFAGGRSASVRWNAAAASSAFFCR